MSVAEPVTARDALDEKLAVSVPKAAALFDFARSTGYAFVASGEWPSIRVGRSVRVPVEALRAWVRRRERVAKRTPCRGGRGPRGRAGNLRAKGDPIIAGDPADCDPRRRR